MTTRPVVASTAWNDVAPHPECSEMTLVCGRHDQVLYHFRSATHQLRFSLNCFLIQPRCPFASSRTSRRWSSNEKTVFRKLDYQGRYDPVAFFPPRGKGFPIFNCCCVFGVTVLGDVFSRSGGRIRTDLVVFPHGKAGAFKRFRYYACKSRRNE